MFRRLVNFVLGRRTVRSRLYRTEVFYNKRRKFGAEGIYFPMIVVSEDGKESRILLTESQIAIAAERYNRNKEDWIE